MFQETVKVRKVENYTTLKCKIPAIVKMKLFNMKKVLKKTHQKLKKKFPPPMWDWTYDPRNKQLIKLGPHDAWFVFVMRHASWFAHRVCKKMCLISVDVSFVHSSHLLRQLGGKLRHQSKLYVSDSTNLFDTFTHDAPRIHTTHCVDPA